LVSPTKADAAGKLQIRNHTINYNQRRHGALSPCLEDHTMKKQLTPTINCNPSFRLNIYGDNYQRTQEYAKAVGVTLDDAINRALEFFLDTKGQVEREASVRRKTKQIRSTSQAITPLHVA
jgi:hypothetical protein